MALEFYHKGEGRIFVFDEKHIKIVHSVLKEMDESEYEIYCPKDIVTVYQKDNIKDDLIYTGKFEIDIAELIQRCAAKKVGIFVRTKAIYEENVFDL